MDLLYYTGKKVPIRLNSQRIGRGGEGNVYEILTPISQFKNQCAKIYFPNQISKEKENKVRFMVNQQIFYQNSDRFLLCLPTDILFDQTGTFAGFIMPKAFSGSIQLYELVTTKIRKNLALEWQQKYDRNKAIGIENRLKLCVNIASAIHTLHQTGNYVLVDFKPQNILVTSDGRISVIDLDSIQISSGTRLLFNAKVATAEYSPVEGEKLIPAKNYIPESWDRFSVAIVFYELLFGLHPYASTAGGQYNDVTTISDKIRRNLFVHGSKRNYLTAIPNIHDNYSRLPESVKHLFLLAFETGSQSPEKRPKVEAWGQTIVLELGKGIIQKRPPDKPKPPYKPPYQPPKRDPSTESTATPQNNTNTSNIKNILFTVGLVALMILGSLYRKGVEDSKTRIVTISPTASSIDNGQVINRSILNIVNEEKMIYPSLRILNVDFTDTTTILNLRYNNGNDLKNHNWINISPSTFIQASGVQYNILETINIPFLPESNQLTKVNQDVDFSLIFPTIMGEATFDLVECNNESCFNFNNVSVIQPQMAVWNNASDTTFNNIGSLMFWTRTPHSGFYTVTLNNEEKGKITTFSTGNNNVPLCGAYGYAQFNLLPGAYSYKIESSFDDAAGKKLIWEGEVQVILGQCSKLEF
jgi:serine/threonine protein kinase